ncbi:MAG: hypothetical protein GFH27_549301n308 [Chloroflexi bacterium AL-W]|nr:hypothetical protein [Chloroflexi bacterium AL-N1]NOK68502.1 hypothetical protein [Chloroflexi bacterium AL-N10]NOK74148.1 hypothetical protein [Chloroflexi bacterium AL-N5]NOK83115.1 hypothetical protein [Chloroflexi bacterium AL-W]NOK90638.1 hypothetical protein [Chloroflexi bacterium AL-N15]
MLSHQTQSAVRHVPQAFTQSSRYPRVPRLSRGREVAAHPTRSAGTGERESGEHPHTQGQRYSTLSRISPMSSIGYSDITAAHAPDGSSATGLPYGFPQESQPTGTKETTSPSKHNQLHMEPISGKIAIRLRHGYTLCHFIIVSMSHTQCKTAFLRRSFANWWLKIPKRAIDLIKCRTFQEEIIDGNAKEILSQLYRVLAQESSFENAKFVV